MKSLLTAVPKVKGVRAGVKVRIAPYTAL